MNLRMFLLTTGETIVGDVLEQHPTILRIKGISLQASPQNNGGGLSLAPVPVGGVFGLLTTDGVFQLERSSIVASADANKQVESIFIQATTGLTVASK